MSRSQTKMHERVNVTLPRETIRLIDRVAEKGKRSFLINEALRFYIAKIGRANLRKQLREGALQRAKRDLRVAKEWLALKNEAWQRSKS